MEVISSDVGLGRSVRRLPLTPSPVPTPSLPGPFRLPSSPADPPSSRQVRWASAGMPSPALHLPRRPGPSSLGKQPRASRLLCCSKAFQFGKANTAKQKGNTLQNSTRPPKEIFLGLFFNFLNWPEAKNVSSSFFLGPSPPPTPSLVSGSPRVLISHRKSGKPQKWPGGAQLSRALPWPPTLPG